MTEWPHGTSYTPLKEVDRDYLPTDSGEGIPRQPPRDGFADKEEEELYWKQLLEQDIENDNLF